MNNNECDIGFDPVQIIWVQNFSLKPALKLQNKKPRVTRTEQGRGPKYRALTRPLFGPELNYFRGPERCDVRRCGSTAVLGGATTWTTFVCLVFMKNAEDGRRASVHHGKCAAERM